MRFHQICNKLWLTLQRITTSDVPAFNPAFLESSGFDNRENLDGLDIFLPRFSFKWDAATDLIVRGGIGSFSGGQPSVWAGNAYGRDGLSQVDTGTVTANSRGNIAQEMRDALSNVDVNTVPDAFLDYVRNGAESEINFNDPNFKVAGLIGVINWQRTTFSVWVIGCKMYFGLQSILMLNHRTAHIGKT
ncbi:hypothetical protein [Alishewanella longhuensis]